MHDWSDIFSLTQQFNEVKLWEKINDRNLFGFLDEASNEPIICSVLGNSANIYGLAIYIGREGLMSLVNSLLRDDHDDQFEILQTQRSILITLEKPEKLTKDAFAFLQEKDGKFQGIKIWPTYTSYQPGYYPWHCSTKELPYIVRALKGAIQLAKDIDEGLFLPNFIEQEKILLQELQDKDATAEYRSVYIENIHVMVYEPSLEISEFELKKIKRFRKRLPMTIEFSYQYLFTPIQRKKGERPIFPVIILALDHEDGSVIHHELLNTPVYTFTVQESFMKMIKILRAIPEKLIVDEKTEYHLIELVRALDLNADLRKELLHTDQFLAEMKDATEVE